MKLFLCTLSLMLALMAEQLPDTFTPLTEGQSPATHPHALWHGWDPKAEPLETEVLHEWEEEGVVLQVVRFRVGVAGGRRMMVAAVYGYPKGQRSLPGLVNVHGGGQYADYRACLTNAKRGYATVALAWAGRIAAPDYRVDAAGVKLFWEGKTDHPQYRVTTDWGGIDAYHAPSRYGKDKIRNISPTDWTLDQVESPRNSSWFLYTMAARRALTFLEEQRNVVDAGKLGIYGHSMGGKITVLTAGSDSRVKAAVPSCGGVSDRYNDSALFQGTIADLPYLKSLKCPTLFLNPVNDFHANFQDFATVPDEVTKAEWRFSFSPQLSHRDVPSHSVATQVWMDHNLKFDYLTPETPQTEVRLAHGAAPSVIVTPDLAKPVAAVDVYFTQQGKLGARQRDPHRYDRYWHHARAILKDGQWTATLPIASTDRPLWIYANVSYALPAEISGAGYYYNSYTAQTVTLSSRPALCTAQDLQEQGVVATLRQHATLERFNAGWDKRWFPTNANSWQVSTHMLSDPHFAPPTAQSTLALRLKAQEENLLAVSLGGYHAEYEVQAGENTLLMQPADFQSPEQELLADFSALSTLTLSDRTRVKAKDGSSQLIGKSWKGEAPVWKSLSWSAESTEGATPDSSSAPDYRWTTDHMHVGVRWQPFGGMPECNAYDYFERDVISQDSSYAQFWVAWPAIEPSEAHTDYAKHATSELKAIANAIDLCKAGGKKVELVFYHVPAWASASGIGGGERPKEGYFPDFMTRIATYFKGRVDAYQLSHEANLEHMLADTDIDYLIDEIFIKGAKAIRAVYGDEPVLVSTSGCSPCEGCPAIGGLDSPIGGAAVSSYYDHLVASDELLSLVDALNMNVSDQNDGSGGMDGTFLPSTWGNYDLVRSKLDAAGHPHIPVISSESWITWDHLSQATDVNADGVKNEQDAYQKTVTIMGQCLSRGLNTMNLPWADNSSSWAMGLTKRVDYNGRVHTLRPEFTYPALDGGPDVVTRKLSLYGGDDAFQIRLGSGENYTAENYAVPGDPNHLHYYIWRWYAQIAGGSDEVIRHAIAGEYGNDIAVIGKGFTGHERYRISSYNRTQKQFNVLLYASGAAGTAGNYTKLTIPARIQTGRHYHTDHSAIDFRGEGLKDGEQFTATIETKRICDQTGQDLDLRITKAHGTVKDGYISFTMHPLLPFTKITIE